MIVSTTFDSFIVADDLKGSRTTPGDWHVCEGTIDTKAYIGILQTPVAIKTMTFPG